MSQAKVDAYKERKRNRKKIEAHEKHMAWLRGLIALLVLALIIAWAGYSAYVRHMDNKPYKTAEVDYTAINDYATYMNEQESEEAEDTAKEDAEGDTAEAETSEEETAEGEAAEGEAEQTGEDSGE